MSHIAIATPAEDPEGNERFRIISENERFDRQFTPTSQLPDPGVFAENLTRRAIEVISGSRDLAQIARWVTDDVFAALQEQVNARIRKMSLIPEDKQQRTIRNFTISHVRLSQPREGVIEACLLVHGSKRMRAVALRLEGFDHRWRASSFTLL
jgi:hypothetical protein